MTDQAGEEGREGGFGWYFPDASPLGSWPRHLCHSEPLNICLVYKIYTLIYIAT